MTFLCRSTKKGRKKTSQGLCPWNPRRIAALRSRLQWKASLSKAALKGFAIKKSSILSAAAAKMGWVQ
jgi:hypothetical protein